MAKYLIFGLIIIALTMCEKIACFEDILEYETLKPSADVNEECLELMKVPIKDVELIRDLQLPETREGKCLLACMYKKIDIMTPEGRYSPQADLEAAQETLSRRPKAMQRVTQIVEFCKLEVENIQDDEEGCEVAAALFACVARRGELEPSEEYSDSESVVEDYEP